MTIIPVPRPSQNAGNPDRPVSSLLLAQIQHLQHAERRLPLRYRSKIYTHAIKTEREAARYIREVTEAIHQAHADAAVQQEKHTHRRKSGLEIAAAAERTRRQRKRNPKAKTGAKTKNSSRKRTRKK
jgi:hypothetical protein